MIVSNMKEVSFKEIKSSETNKAFIKVLVGKDQGWDDYVMRLLELQEGGFSPLHKHPWPHINFIVEGEGELEIEGVSYPLTKGSFAYVDSMKMHQFRNVGNQPFQFICIVPKEGHTY